MRAYGFEEMLAVGEHGFYEVETLLNKLPQTYVILDRQNDPQYQDIDVDFIWIYDNKGKIEKKLCELKTDRLAHKTGNMFIETHSSIEHNTKGNFIYTECDYFMYYLIETRKLIITELKPLRSYIKRNKDKYKTKKAKSLLSKDKHYTSKGLLVPIREIEKELPTTTMIVTPNYYIRGSY